MTEIVDLTKDGCEKSDKIVLKEWFDISDSTWSKTDLEPDNYEKVVLLSKDYFRGSDLIAAYQSNGLVTLYLGHWNGGVI